MSELFYHFGFALAIGLLIGMERQFNVDKGSEKSLFGGVRTFPLLALTGCAAAMLADLGIYYTDFNRRRFFSGGLYRYGKQR